MNWNGPVWLYRLLAVAVALLATPAVLGVSDFLQDTPIRVGEPSPRTVVAPDTIRVSDPEATELARREAAASVLPVLVSDDGEKAAIVQTVADRFAVARSVRAAGPDAPAPTRAEQVEALTSRLEILDEEGLRLLVGLSDAQLADVAEEAVSIAQVLARQDVREERLDEVVEGVLRTEFAVRRFPSGVAEKVVAPIIRGAARPTVRVDPAATAGERQRAADEVAEVQRTYTAYSVIVSAGEVVDELQYAALRTRGLEGSEPWPGLLRSLAVMAVLVLVVSTYLRAYRPRVWQNSSRLLLLASIGLLFAVTLEVVSLLAPAGTPAWLYVVPIGAVTMLATILFDPPVGVLMTVPATILVAFTLPGEPGVTAFAAVAGLGSVPLVSRLSARGDLRRAAWRSTLGYTLLAALFAAVFDDLEAVPVAALAGLLNGVAVAVIVNGSLPFLESVFGVLTATSLLDLADRNHPLLRELEQKALGSYNHSIMVSTLAERAARAIGADHLLASVAALYHDIGKVRRPYFFVENQFGIENPHDELEPELSALIIQNHVTDGIEMARSVRLPPEVVEGIATHHGTTLVTYFYRQALQAAKVDPKRKPVDEERFRYKGRKPSSKEMAILMLADCCEGASRASALNNRNLTRKDLESIVLGLVTERVEDGQLDESALTFRELAAVQESFIETLVGVYHPRIAYPAAPDAEQSDGEVVAPPGVSPRTAAVES